MRFVLDAFNQIHIEVGGCCQLHDVSNYVGSTLEFRVLKDAYQQFVELGGICLDGLEPEGCLVALSSVDCAEVVDYLVNVQVHVKNIDLVIWEI